jgi:hypothetical protein
MTFGHFWLDRGHSDSPYATFSLHPAYEELFVGVFFNPRQLESGPAHVMQLLGARMLWVRGDVVGPELCELLLQTDQLDLKRWLPEHAFSGWERSVRAHALG